MSEFKCNLQLQIKLMQEAGMDRRTLLAGLCHGLTLTMITAAAPAFAKDKSADDGTTGTEGGMEAGGADAGTVKSSTTDDPGTEAQPEDATQCAAGTDCKKK